MTLEEAPVPSVVPVEQVVAELSYWLGCSWPITEDQFAAVLAPLGWEREVGEPRLVATGHDVSEPAGVVFSGQGLLESLDWRVTDFVREPGVVEAECFQAHFDGVVAAMTAVWGPGRPLVGRSVAVQWLNADGAGVDIGMGSRSVMAQVSSPDLVAELDLLRAQEM